MLTEDKKQIFEDNTGFVEFKFKKNNEKYWQWVPIRVRHDKTADYRKGTKISETLIMLLKVFGGQYIIL